MPNEISLLILLLLNQLEVLSNVAKFRPEKSIFYKWEWFRGTKLDRMITIVENRNLTNANDGYHWLKAIFTMIACYFVLVPFYGWFVFYYLPIVWLCYYSIIFNFSYHYVYMRKEYRDLERSWPWRYILK